MIAPKEIIGNAKFPSLLGGIQEGVSTQPGVARPASGQYPNKATPDSNESPESFLASMQLPLAQSGNLLPSNGTPLPTGLPDGHLGLLEEAERVAKTAPSLTTAPNLGQDAKLGSAHTRPIEAGLTAPRFEPEGPAGAGALTNFPRPNGIIGEPVFLSATDPVPAARIEPASDQSIEQEIHGLADRAPGSALPVSRVEAELEATDQAMPATSIPVPLQPRVIEQEPDNSFTQPKDAKAREVLDVRSLHAAETGGNSSGDRQAPVGASASTAAKLQADAAEMGGSRANFAAVAGEPIATSKGVLKTAAQAKVPAIDGFDVAPSKAALEAAPINSDGVSQPKPEKSETAESRPSPAAAQIAMAATQAGRIAKADVAQGKIAQRADLRVIADKQASQAALSTPAAISITPVLGEVESDPVAPRLHPSPGLNLPIGPSASPAHTSLTPLDAGAPQQSINQPPTAAAAASAAPQQASAAPVSDTSAAFRPSPQLERTIDQLTQTRSDAQASKPELTVRHQEFGAITMRLDAGGGDLRATLSARDPGFVPAIQSALAERSVATTSETSGSGAQRGNEQSGSQSNSQSSFQSGSQSGAHGQGWNSGGQYGSSTGAGQGTSQPYSVQTEVHDEETASDQANRLGDRSGILGDGERFA
jgi:hypothetical protein